MLFAIGDIKIHYEIAGEGPALLFFPETACAGDVWNRFQVPEFSRDHLVITHDYRGTGKSSRPTTQYSCEDFVDDAAALLDHLNAGPAILLGHSMGGRVAMLMALKYPAKVKKLIVASVGPGFSSAPPIPFKMCKEMAEWGYEKYVREHTIQVGFTDGFVKAHSDRVETFFRARLANLCPVEFYLRHVLARQSHNTSARLKDIRVPTLVMVGAEEGDPGSAISHLASSEILAKNIPGAKFVVLPGQKHNYFASAPEEAHRIIREFLRA